MKPFRWDPRKARANWQKHGVTFAEAETVFFTKLARSTTTRITPWVKQGRLSSDLLR